MADRSPWQTDLLGTLAATRRVIRRQLTAIGLARLAVLAGVAFWLLDGWDLLYFQATKLEQPKPLRVVLIAAATATLVAFGLWWLVTRRLRAMPDDAVALTIERVRPSLQQRLITAVQSTRADSPLGDAMAARTQRVAVDALSDFEPRELVRREPLLHPALAALSLWSAVGLTAVFAPSHIARWAEAYLRFDDDYWNDFRTTRATLRVARGPSESLVPFDETRTVRAARGANLTVVATIEEGTVVPERVRLTAVSRNDRGDSQTVSMLPTDDGSFRHTFPRLYDDQLLTMVAGDFATSQPYRIEVVDPPRIDRLAMRVDYPDYTGLNRDGVDPQPVLSSRVALPAGSVVEFLAEANKPIRSVRIVAGSERAERSASGDRFSFVATVDAAAPVESDEAGEVAASGTSDAAIAISETADVEISLVDEDGLRSLAPLSLIVEALEDLPPTVSARPRGIGSAVTQKARLPWSGTVTDDYGIDEAWFRLRVDDDEPQQAAVDVPARRRDWTIDPDDPVVLDLRDFKPQLEQTLEVALAAADANPTGTRPGTSEAVLLKVVSAEELLAILRSKELNLRQRFESIVEEVTATRDDIREQRQRERDASAMEDSPERTRLLQTISAGIDRDLLAVRKNASEAAAIFELFGDLRAEMVNNRVETRDLLDRIDRGVLTPLDRVLADSMPRVDRSVVAARDAIRSRGEVAETLAVADRELSRLVDRLAAILAEMQRRQSYNELIEELQELTRRYEKLTEETKSRGVDDFFDDLLE